METLTLILIISLILLIVVICLKTGFFKHWQRQIYPSWKDRLSPPVYTFNIVQVYQKQWIGKYVVSNPGFIIQAGREYHAEISWLLDDYVFDAIVFKTTEAALERVDEIKNGYPWIKDPYPYPKVVEKVKC